MPELRKFGIKIAKENKAAILNGDLVQDIVQQLYDYDQAILTYPTVEGNIQSKTIDKGRNAKKIINNSELNFPLNKVSIDGVSPIKKRRYL